MVLAMVQAVSLSTHKFVTQITLFAVEYLFNNLRSHQST